MPDMPDMTEKCSEVREAIALEGKAPASEDCLEHLGECTECARFLKSVLAVETELGTLATPDVDDAIVDTLLARPELSTKTSSHKLQWAMGLAAAATIVFLAARVTLIGHDQPREFEVAVAQNGAVVGGEGRPEENELSSEETESLQAPGYVGNDPENRPGPQYRGQTTSRDDVIASEKSLNDEAARAELSLRARELQRSYSVSTEEGNERENNNAPLKKDEGLLGSDVGAGRTAFGDRLEGAASAPEPSLEDSPKRASQFAALPDGLAEQEQRKLRALEEAVTVTGESPSIDSGARVSEDLVLDKAQIVTDDFRSRLVRQDADGAFYQRTLEPDKLVHVDAVYPESAKAKRVSGIVTLRVLIDSNGIVTRATVVDSVEELDQAAIHAVLQWKYAASEIEERSVTVRIAFDAPAAPDDDARLFLEERDRIDNLHFRDPRGYWANTYLPGDPRARFLAMRLRNAGQPIAPHLSARPVVQPFDPPSRGALSVTLHADHRGVSGPARLLLQVGVKATDNYGRRRPPMNVGIVLDADPDNIAAARALGDSLRRAKALGDRFRLFVPGKGEVVPPESFRHGPLAVALDELEGSSHLESDLESAVRLAVERVHAGDDPTMPLGSSLVLVVTSRKLGGELEALSRLAHQSAIGGVPVSVVGLGASVDRDELERLALSGQGRRYFLEQTADATGIVDRELASSSRVVARALRLRIKLAADVRLVDVIGSESLSERQADRAREAEKSIDLRLSRNLGIEADRGEDEDGIQIIIPSFYAGDSHTILLDVVATRPGAIAEVTARYKDLSELRNTVAKASLSLSRSEAAPGPLETNVLKNYLSFRLSQELESAADELDRGDRDAAVKRLRDARHLLVGLGFGNDQELARDIAMLSEYVGVLSSSLEPALIAYLADSLRYAGASKRRLPAALT